MPPKKTPPKDTDSAQGNYPRKYWWLILIVVPLLIATIQYRPWQRASAPSGSSNSFTARDISIVVNEAARSGVTLSAELVDQLKQAAQRSEEGQHAAAAAAIQQVRASSGQVAALPALLGTLADEYRLAGDEAKARQTYQAVLDKDPANQRSLSGLSQLPDGALKGLEVVNFTSQSESILSPRPASNIVDGDPSTIWASRDGQFPQTFIVRLPVDATISEISFNNPSLAADTGAKDIELSFSSDSASSGFVVADTVTLAPNDIGQGFKLKSQPVGRWLKIRILSNHGNKGWTSLGDVTISGKPRVG